MTITLQSQNKLLSSIDEYYDGSTWQKNSGFNYEYDNNNNLIAETYYSWDTGTWEINDKAIYTYNLNNKVTQVLYQVWNPETNKFEIFDRDTYTYTNGKITEIGYNRWENSNWVFDDRNLITYNSNNLPETALSYNWDGLQWVNESRTTLTYSSTNKVISEINEKFINSQWVNDYKTLYTYNSNNKIITTKSANWDEFNTIWVENDRTDYELDATGNRIIETKSGNYKKEYTYDTTKFMSGFAHPFEDKTGFDFLFEDFPYVNKVLTSNGFSYNTNTSSYENTSRTTYNYTNFITLGTETVELLADKNITVYPNPASSILNVSIEDNATIDRLIITDISAKKIMEQTGSSTSINIENLAKGMYVLEVFVGENKETRKFIKQ